MSCLLSHFWPYGALPWPVVRPKMNFINMDMRRRQQDELLAACEAGKVCTRDGGEAKMHYACTCSYFK